MTEKSKTPILIRWFQVKSSAFFSWAFGVSPERKIDLFIDLSRAATLKDAVYWLQIIFASGIATLGLVLSSPAVIIGAMLISPLMNPILASGLALATGDLVLGLRAVVNLILSCGAAICFAVLLVVLLPFREMTPEIAARTQPNVLDLLIALFSGAIGSVAICREVKGVVTSIPGVAIAVALMPPLCVVGYGIGLMLAFDSATGWRVASGGGLLFLTNFVAITLMAMLVFLVLRMDTAKVRDRGDEWKRTDAESSFIISVLRFFPGLERAQKIHSLAMRLGMVLLPLILILIPLSSAFSQLQKEIIQKQNESRIRQIVTDVWQESFQKKIDGLSRSSIDQLTISEKDDKLNINLRVFDDEPYTLAEKKDCAVKIAEKLNLPVEAINLKLTEIPTVSVIDAIEQARKEASQTAPTLAELQQNLVEQVDIALSDFKLPAPAQVLNKEVVSGVNEPLKINLIFLSDERLSSETQTALLNDIRNRLQNKEALLRLERVPVDVGEIVFSKNGETIDFLGMMSLDFAGRTLRANSGLVLVIEDKPRRRDTADSRAARLQTIADYLESRWQISSDQIKVDEKNAVENKTNARYELIEKPKNKSNEPPQG